MTPQEDKVQSYNPMSDVNQSYPLAFRGHDEVLRLDERRLDHVLCL